MPDSFETYFEIILAERSWSWTLIGILYLFAGLIIRSWFLAPLAKQSRLLKSTYSRELKGIYLQHAIWGWLFFMFSFFIAIGLWASGAVMPISIKEALCALGAVVSYVLSILLHVEAIGVAAIATLRKLTEKEA